MAVQTKSVFRFADLEVHEHELRATRAGQPLDIEPKAFRVLVYLVKHAGHLVSKSELMDGVWGDTAVTENSLTRAIALLRRVLEDDPHQPHFIETVSTAGYRFICPVASEEPSVPSQVAEGTSISGETQQKPEVQAPASTDGESRGWLRPWRWPRAFAAGILAATVIMAVAWWEWLSTPAVPVVTSIEPLTRDSLWKARPVTDGNRVYFNEDVKQNWVHGVLAQVSVGGGESSTIPTPFDFPWLHDIAPDRLSLLVSEYRWDEPSSLWILPLPQGAPRKVGNVVAELATWTSDGKQIIFVKGAEIWISTVDGSQMRKLWSAPGRIVLLRASPDGKRMRFTVCEQSGCALWEANTDGSRAHPLLAGWQVHPLQFGGSWSSDGRYYVFGAGTSRGDYSYEDLWLLNERRGWFSRRQPAPVQLTRGPLFFYLPGAVFSPDGHTLFAQGVVVRAQLVRYDPTTHRAAEYLSGIPAQLLSFSPDGQWISYVSALDRSLWRCRRDGSERVQLTSPADSVAFISRWSPDGTKIAFEWTPLGKTEPKLALISRDGGAPEQAIPDSEDNQDQNDPTWSPDGNEIIFARDLNLAEVERMELLRVDLRTKKVAPVPGSKGLYSPRWSPDGRYLAAFPVDTHSILLFDFQKQVWKTWFTADEGHVAWNLWSTDSRALYFQTDRADHLAWWRIGLGEQKPTKLVDMPDERILNYSPTLAPDGGALYTRDLSTYEIYALHLSEK